MRQGEKLEAKAKDEGFREMVSTRRRRENETEEARNKNAGNIVVFSAESESATSQRSFHHRGKKKTSLNTSLRAHSARTLTRA